MKSIKTIGLFLFGFAGLVNAQPMQNKPMNPSYVESCTQYQVQMHRKIKEMSADQFRTFCECTSKQLMNSLSAAQLDELSKDNKRPAWLKPAEDAASKNCLKPEPKTQA